MRKHYLSATTTADSQTMSVFVKDVFHEMKTDFIVIKLKEALLRLIGTTTATANVCLTVSISNLEANNYTPTNLSSTVVSATPILKMGAISSIPATTNGKHAVVLVDENNIEVVLNKNYLQQTGYIDLSFTVEGSNFTLGTIERKTVVLEFSEYKNE